MNRERCQFVCGRGRPHDSRSPTATSKDRSPGAPVSHPNEQISLAEGPGLETGATSH
jgi:hypothetical protein